MKIPICQRVFQYFCHFFIFSGTYRKQCGANAVFCAFCAVWGGIFIPPEYRLSAPAPKIGCPVSATTANRASSIADRQNRKHALYPVSTRTPQCRHPNSNTLSRRRRPRSLRESVNSHLYMRACRQCVHESARFFRVICSHAW